MKDSVYSFYSDDEGEAVADIVSEAKGDRAIEALKRASIIDVQAHLAMVAELASKNPENKAMFRKRGTPKVLVKVAKNKMEASPLVAVDCFQALMLVVEDDPDVEETLGQLGVLEIIADALRIHAQNEAVVELSLRLLRRMTLSTDTQNIAEFGQLEGNELVVKAMGGGARMGIAIEALHCIGNLGTHHVNAAVFGQCGATEEISRLMETHGGDVGFVVAASNAICVLCNNDNHCLQKMGTSGISKALATAMLGQPYSPDVADACLRAVISLAKNEANRAVLGEGGVCSAIASALEIFPTVDVTVNLCCQAAIQLCTVAANKSHFTNLGILQALQGIANGAADAKQQSPLTKEVLKKLLVLLS